MTVLAVAENLAPLTAEIVEDDEALEAWVDDAIRGEPVAEARRAEIAMLVECLRCAVEPDAWALAVEIERRVTQRWEDLASVLVRYGFEAARRLPLKSAEVSR